MNETTPATPRYVEIQQTPAKRSNLLGTVKIVGTVALVIGGVYLIYKYVWPFIKGIGGLLVNAWNALNAGLNWLSQSAGQGVSGIRGLFTKAQNAIGGAIHQAQSAMASYREALSQGTSGAWSAAVNAMSTLQSTMATALQSVAAAAGAAGESAGAFSNQAASAGHEAASWLSQAASDLSTSISSALQSVNPWGYYDPRMGAVVVGRPIAHTTTGRSVYFP